MTDVGWLGMVWKTHNPSVLFCVMIPVIALDKNQLSKSDSRFILDLNSIFIIHFSNICPSWSIERTSDLLNNPISFLGMLHRTISIMFLCQQLQLCWIWFYSNRNENTVMGTNIFTYHDQPGALGGVHICNDVKSTGGKLYQTLTLNGARLTNMDK